MLIGFTCKFNKDITSYKIDLSFIYEKYIERFTRQNIQFLETRYEYDKSGILHVHALIDMPNSMRWPHFHAIAKFDGMHYFKREITNKQGWLDYIRKDSVPKPPTDWSDEKWDHAYEWFKAIFPQYFIVPGKTRNWYFSHPEVYIHYMLRSPHQIALDCIKHGCYQLIPHEFKEL